MSVSDCKKFENKLLKENKEIISILLKDNTTKRNIVWGTDNYANYGINAFQNINVCQVMKKRQPIIKTRYEKEKYEQVNRSKSKGEVFTPSWICNKQNNLIDNVWFGRENAFNYEMDKAWKTTKIVLFGEKNWKDYVDDLRLEITCGEAPYLVSRYDSVTGKRYTN